MSDLNTCLTNLYYFMESLRISDVQCAITFGICIIIDLDIQKGPKSSLNIVSEIPCQTSYLMAIVMLALSVIISKMFAVKILHDHDLHAWNESRSNPYMLIENSYIISYLTSIVMIAISVTISKLFAVKMCMTLSMTFRLYQIQI